MKRSQTRVGYQKKKKKKDLLLTSEWQHWTWFSCFIFSITHPSELPLRGRAQPQSTTGAGELGWNVPQATTSTDWSTLKHSKNCFFFLPPPTPSPNFERAHVCSNERVNTDLTVLGGHAPVSETLGPDRLQGSRGLGCESKEERDKDTVNWVRACGSVLAEVRAVAGMQEENISFRLKNSQLVNSVCHTQFQLSV